MNGFTTPAALGSCAACGSRTVTAEGTSVLADYCLWDNGTDCEHCAVCGACKCGASNDDQNDQEDYS